MDGAMDRICGGGQRVKSLAGGRLSLCAYTLYTWKNADLQTLHNTWVVVRT